MINNNLQEQNLIREISFSLTRNAGWIKFLGIILLANGILTALSIIGLIVAWLPIWMGYLLLKAASKTRAATSYGDATAFQESLQLIGNYFIINGVIVLISIFAVLLIVFGIIFWGLSFDPDTFESILSWNNKTS